MSDKTKLLGQEAGASGLLITEAHQGRTQHGDLPLGTTSPPSPCVTAPDLVRLEWTGAPGRALHNTKEMQATWKPPSARAIA